MSNTDIQRFGVLFDAYGSSKVGNMLDDNEKSIKKHIGVSNEN